MKQQHRGKKTAGLGAAAALMGMMLAGGWLHAQAPPAPGESKPAEQQKPAPKPSQSNPFPEDTNSVPVLPNGTAPAVPEAGPAAAGAAPALPAYDVDPVRSPDDPVAEAPRSSGESSSSLGSLDSILQPPPDDTDTRRRRKGNNQSPPEHQETAKEDESVGSYYLDQKNWRGALSRFQSALVLDPDNPDVYWGLAEAQRRLGDVSHAKANYQKVMEYDPGSKHAKEAEKLLKEPDRSKSSPGAPQK
ncbi:MAG TPA: tetratricopeptide repeat protein [Terracidiphilus sp.]|jgi:tetratricopeptide (TPR) repeat protein|nr:tetratricopeptide repeat protein [Terracidiphilus sp.]